MPITFPGTQGGDELDVGERDGLPQGSGDRDADGVADVGPVAGLHAVPEHLAEAGAVRVAEGAEAHPSLS